MNRQHRRQHRNLPALVIPSALLLFLSACTVNKDKDRIAQLEKQNSQMEQQIRALTAAAKSREAVPDSEVFTLYRSSPFGADLRVPVGTFDTRSFDDPSQNKQYNYEICSDAQLNFNERNKGEACSVLVRRGAVRKEAALRQTMAVVENCWVSTEAEATDDGEGGRALCSYEANYGAISTGRPRPSHSAFTP